MSPTKTTRTASGRIQFPRLTSRLLELGMTVSTWDAADQCAAAVEAGSEFCRTVCGGQCRNAGPFVQSILATGQGVCGQGPMGCCLVGTPIYQRRRLLGAVVAGFPVWQMADGDCLAQLAASTGQSIEALVQASSQDCRRTMADGPGVLKTLGWLLEQEQVAEVSKNEITTLSANLATTYEELSLVYSISGTMKVTQGPAEFLQSVCKELAEVMNISAAIAVAYAHPASADDDEVVIAGDVDMNVQQIKMLASSYIAPRLLAGNRVILDNNFQAAQSGQQGLGIRNLIAAPLGAEKMPIGMMIGVNKRTGDFDSIDMKLINSIANQAAVFLANNRLYADLQDLLMGLLHALTSSIDAKDPYTCGHSQRVAIISRRLALALGLSSQKVQQIYLMGLLHDIGKIGVPESVLCKAGRLTDEEFDKIKLHPTVGAKILGGIRQLDDIIVGIVSHHERPDGKGYPRGLKGNEVPYEGLIVGLADCFDAMTSNRTYRAALPMATVIQEIRNHSGTQFHPDVVAKLLEMDLEKFLEELRQPARTVFPVGSQERSNLLEGASLAAKSTPNSPAASSLESQP